MFRIEKNLWIIFFIVIITLLFNNWIQQKYIIGGDWPFYFQEKLVETSLIPNAWSSQWPYGLGGNQLSILPLKAYLHMQAVLFVQYLGLSWSIVQKIFWFWGFLALATFSSYYLTKSIVGILIYTTNTFVLLLIGGGQMGVALSYAIAPLVIYSFINLLTSSRVNKLNKRNKESKNSLINNPLIKNSLIFSLTYSAQVMFDPRIAYITGIAGAIYFFINGLKKNAEKNARKNSLITNSLITNKIIYIFIIPIIVVLGLHAFWILPMLATGNTGISQLGSGYTSIESVKFFSFAKFENAISLLHPNWPENVFGKVGFQKPEFLILPVLAFSSLLFINEFTGLRVRKHINLLTSLRVNGLEKNIKRTGKNNSLITNSLIANKIIFFTLLALLGAFLAKGANPPFGGVYLWMFEHIPGFIMFRDPTKFYLLISLSYSVLIPYSLSGLGKLMWRITNSK